MAPFLVSLQRSTGALYDDDDVRAMCCAARNDIIESDAQDYRSNWKIKKISSSKHTKNAARPNSKILCFVASSTSAPARHLAMMCNLAV